MARRISIDDLMVIPPFSHRIPIHPMARIHAFVRELATGTLHHYWSSTFRVSRENKEILWHPFARELDVHSVLTTYLSTKWGGEQPEVDVLCSLGYLKADHPRYELTAKAYELVDDTPEFPVFISYRNTDSSAFALLLVARMKAQNLEPFLDISSLRGGDEWDALLQRKIRECQYFVALVGPTTLQSNYVRKEIRLAHEHHVQIVPIFHNGYAGEQLRLAKEEGDDIAAILETRQGITVREEKTLDYNTAVIELLNLLGVAP